MVNPQKSLTTYRRTTWALACALALEVTLTLGLLTAAAAHAEVVELTPLAPVSSSPTPAQPGAQLVNPDTIDLGEQLPNQNPGVAARAGTQAVAGAATRAATAAAATAAAAAAAKVKRASSATSAGASAANAGPAMAKPGSGATERVVFARLPVRVALSVDRERLVTLPGLAALHVPADIDSVARIENIDRTLYVTALVPFTAIRIVAEMIDGGQQIPLDLVATKGGVLASNELEVFLTTPRAASIATGARDDAAAPVVQGEETPVQTAANMVELTRFASRMLYAPRRLAWGLPNVQQVQLAVQDAPALVPGARVNTKALAQWRSGDLYVTAVQVTNLSARPLELPLESLRGRWVAVTAQHGRIGPAGSETDTTALYLVCDRAFEACL
jgi:integrating conjugative element protein (TIGR03749 family)